MKKKKGTKVPTLLLTGLCSVTALFAEPIKVGDIYYEITGANTVKVVADHSVNPNLNSYEGEIEIPEQVEIEGNIYTVTEIGESAFRQAFGLNAVTLPNTINRIDFRAFYACYGIQDLVIPASVRVLEAEALANSGIKNLTIEEGLDSIAFGSLGYLNSMSAPLRLPASLRVIEPGAIGFSHLLEEYVVADDNPYFKSVDGVIFSKDGKTLYAFPCHKNTEEYSVPTGVEYVKDFACSNLDFVTSFTFPRTKMKVGKCSFAFNYKLNEVKNGGYITEMDSAAFAGNDRLLLFEAGLYNEVIGESAFAAAGRFTNEPFICDFTISNGLKAIKSKAFNGSRLNKITIPASVDSIAQDAFLDCFYFDSFNVANGNKNYVSLNGSLYSSDLQTLHCVPAGNSNEVFTFPVNVRDIDDYAFYATKVKLVSFPESVEKFGRNAFSKSSLIQIDIPVKVSELPFECFSESSLTSVDVPSTISIVGEGLFRGCTSMAVVKLPEGLDLVADNMFKDCYTLTDVSLPSTIRRIGNSAFLNCYDLPEIIIPDSCESIGQSCFIAQPSRTNHGKLTTVTLGIALAEIGNQCFIGQEAITSIKAKSTVPPIMEDPDFTFSASVLANAEVTVYDCALSDYQSALGWEAFNNWNTMSSVESVTDYKDYTIPVADGCLIGNGQYFEVYNLCGQCLYRGRDQFTPPSHGLYLIKSSCKTQKLML